MRITAKETGSGDLTAGDLKRILKGVPDAAIMVMVAGKDEATGYYLVEGSWDPEDIETPKDPEQTHTEAGRAKPGPKS